MYIVYTCRSGVFWEGLKLGGYIQYCVITTAALEGSLFVCQYMYDVTFMWTH